MKGVGKRPAIGQGGGPSPVCVERPPALEGDMDSMSQLVERMLVGAGASELVQGLQCTAR